MRTLLAEPRLLHDLVVRDFALPFTFVLVLGACASGDEGRDNPIFTTSSGNTDNTDLETGDGDGDGDETSGDGDGEPTTGDGDGAPGDGDGDGEGDGDGDPTTGDAQCGDDMKEGDEQCDGNDLGGLNCLDFGFEDGTLVCANDCTIFTNACSTCGDGQLSPTETCDGGNFGGLTCTDLGFAGGNLSCSADCKSVIQTGCMQAPTCGNGNIDVGEECDGGNLNGNTCQSLGFDAGSLSCTAGCMLNTNGCTIEQCTPLFGGCTLLNDTCCDGLTCIPGFGCLPE
jgi:hypothetical protein